MKADYRRELARSFDQTRYHQRNMVETVFSVIKRKFGEALKARKFQAQIKELKIKLILYNISIIILAIFIQIYSEEFYRAFCIFVLIQSLQFLSIKLPIEYNSTQWPMNLKAGTRKSNEPLPFYSESPYKRTRGYH
jgi:hypothetical protein